MSKSQINRCRDIQTKVCEYKNTKDYNNVSHCTVLNVFEISETVPIILLIYLTIANDVDLFIVVRVPE